MRPYALMLVMALLAAAPLRAEWRAGIARAAITPDQPMWLSGYATRDHAATGQLTDLWAKTLVLEDAAGHRGVIITLDLVGIDRETSLMIRNEIIRTHGLSMADIVICTSHTHSGPVVGSNLKAMYALDEGQWQLVEEYTAQLRQRVLRIVDDAMAALRPAELAWAIGRCTFAVNRRENREADVESLREQNALKGPVDHEAPVLRVTVGGEVRAVLFGYACHATTLNGFDWCGDWPGYAQMAIEGVHPGATALFFAGCGADQNPLPRRTVELAKEYGAQMADAVNTVLSSDMKPITATLHTEYAEVDLPFADVPTRQQLQQTLAADDVYEVRRARHLLRQLGDDETATLSATYPYPVQTWRIGAVTGVFLGGEAIVDYSLAIKSLDRRVDFVASYANDVMAYIPSERVLAEGGYEGGGAMVYYGLPSFWRTGVERLIMDTVRSQLRSLPP